MSLGNNRDYKTTDRRARRNLAAHKQLMDAYIAQGMSREDASKQAFSDMTAKRTKKDTMMDCRDEDGKAYQLPAWMLE